MVVLLALAFLLLLAAWIWQRSTRTERGEMFFGSSWILFTFLFLSFLSIITFIGYNLWQIGGC